MALVDPGIKTLAYRGGTGLLPDLHVDVLVLHERMPPYLVRRPQGSPLWLAIVFHDPARVAAAGGDWQVPANTLMVWPPGEPHLLGNERERWDHSWLYVHGAAWERMLRDSGIVPGAPLQLADPAPAERWLHGCIAELQERAPADGIAVHHLLELWLRACARATAGAQQHRREQRMLMVRRLLEERLGERHRLSDLAAAAGLSVSHLCSEFRACFGVPPGAYLAELRLQEACRLLGDDALQVQEVGRRCGYADAFHFSRAFKSRFGVSPRAWRRGGGNGAS